MTVGFICGRKDVLADDDPEPIILSGHKGKVVNLSFSDDGTMLASASWDGSIGLWPLDRGIERAERTAASSLGMTGR